MSNTRWLRTRLIGIGLGMLMALAPVWADSPGAAVLELRDGDRVALIGATLVEREPHYAFWESAIAARLAHENIVFRNLGWSGDTVFGAARASFDPLAKGFERLIAVTGLVKPTVILLAYGVNESFEGEAGLDSFLTQYKVLLDKLAPMNARIGLITPLPLEPPIAGAFNPPPNPDAANMNIALYAEAIRKLAAERGLALIDLHAWRESNAQGERLTDNTMHMTAAGYRRTADFIAASLGAKAEPWSVEIQAGEKSASAEGTTLTELSRATDGTLKFELTDRALPLPPLPVDAPKEEANAARERQMQIAGLALGTWALKADGVEIARASAEEWAQGVELTRGPEIEHAVTLRDAILKKNELFFHRWRPQNETYLFGFRKHEQGQNAKEIPEFDPLIAEGDMMIAGLRAPKLHKYELVKVGERVK